MTSTPDQVKVIKKGLDVPISGKPNQVIDDDIHDGVIEPVHVAVLGEDYVGLKPTMMVEEGDAVLKGQPLFEDKKSPGVIYTAPASGTITAINRGRRRMLESVVIECQGDEQVTFTSFDDVSELSRDQVQQNLVKSGLWTALRARPFSRVPKLDTLPAGIFVTAIDSNPLAADPRVIIAEHEQAFAAGIKVLTRLTEGKVYLCHDEKASLPGHDLPQVESHRFAGVHPAGVVGTHIHFVLPVSLERTVWHLGYQDVIAYGKLFLTGELYTDRVISLAGPSVLAPRLIRTRVGAKLSQLTKGELKTGNNRVVSGSVLSGHTAAGTRDFLGRFHTQVSVLAEDANHKLLPWVRLGTNKFSITRAMLSSFKCRSKLFDFTTHVTGGERAILSFGQLDRVMPLDILPTLLVRDLVVRDTDEAQALGALELDEADLALCTFVCPGKYDFGKELRACLDIIEREG